MRRYRAHYDVIVMQSLHVGLTRLHFSSDMRPNYGCRKIFYSAKRTKQHKNDLI